MYFVIQKDTKAIVGVASESDLPLPGFMSDCEPVKTEDIIKNISFDSEIEKIAKVLEKAGLYYEVYEDCEDAIFIDIEWGDWKHSHIFCDNIMKALGYTQVGEEVTDEDDSDCYGATHRYEKAA